jgi:hypothetical protein
LRTNGFPEAGGSARRSGHLTDWYHGETTNTAFVESTINQVVSKRFVKKQQKSAEEVRGGQSHSQTRSLGWTIANHLAGQAHHSAHQGAHRDTQRLSFLKPQQFSCPGRQNVDGCLNQKALRG